MSHLLGGAWGEEQPSAARLDAKNIFVGTGADIANITIASTIPFALCTEDGSGFLRNHLYHRHFDPEEDSWTGWDDVSRKHTHADDTETEGGDYYDIDIANHDLLSIRRPYLTSEMFYYDVSGATGPPSVMDGPSGGNQRLLLRTGTAANQWAQVQNGGIKGSFSSRMQWHVKYEIDATGSPPAVLWRMGVGIERVQENSEATLQKFGIEGCSGDGSTVQLVSCDGQTRLKTNTAVGMDQNASIGVKIDYIPSTSVIYYDTIGTIKPSGGNFPSSGAIGSDKLLRYGIKTTNTTEKLMYIWADALFGKTLDVSWI